MNYQNLLQQLKSHEGLRLKPYKCTSGYWTIGYGRNLEAKGLSQQEQNDLLGCDMGTELVIRHLQRYPLTEHQAEELLLNDVASVESQVLRHCDVAGMNDARLAVLINMAFNMGINGLLQFRRLFAAIRQHHWDDAASEMLDSRWALQVGYRAKELAEQMRTGEWQ